MNPKIDFGFKDSNAELVMIKRVCGIAVAVVVAVWKKLFYKKYF